MQSNAQPIYNNFFQQNNNNMNYMPQQNNMSQMSQQQMQLFEIQKMQARQLGALLKKQKELVERMKRNEEQKQNEDREVIIFFNHNYDILPLSFKQNSTMVCEALSKYIEQTQKNDAKFKYEGIELNKEDFKSLKELGIINGSEITVEC
jgi:hypothetical protein